MDTLAEQKVAYWALRVDQIHRFIRDDELEIYPEGLRDYRQLKRNLKVATDELLKSMQKAGF